MSITLIKPDDAGYPQAVEQRYGRRPTITALGDVDLLQGGLVALFCSIKCPGDVILRTYDLIRALRDAGVSMIGGFHSPMEKECLTLLLRGTQPVIVCPARSIEGMRVPRPWREPLVEGRLLVLSIFEKKDRRVTADTALARNLFVAALAGQILVAHAGAGSRTERFVRQLFSRGKPIFTVATEDNRNLVTSGARPIGPDDVNKLANHSRQGLSG
jgi:predicted Rossmann fold nucleotide-binding protein DprA/Smf involved in DNA uptake